MAALPKRAGRTYQSAPRLSQSPFSTPIHTLGRKSWLFCGSDRGGQRAAVMYSLIVTAKMNDVDPQAWLADVLARIAEHPAQRLDDLLPWNWATSEASATDRAA